MQVLQTVQELPELDDSDLDAICAKCNRYKRMGSGEPYQCERCFKWLHAECLQPATTVAKIEAHACWTCPGCAPPLQQQLATRSTYNYVKSNGQTICKEYITSNQ